MKRVDSFLGSKMTGGRDILLLLKVNLHHMGPLSTVAEEERACSVNGVKPVAHDSMTLLSPSCLKS